MFLHSCMDVRRTCIRPPGRLNNLWIVATRTIDMLNLKLCVLYEPGIYNIVCSTDWIGNQDLAGPAYLTEQLRDGVRLFDSATLSTNARDQLQYLLTDLWVLRRSLILPWSQLPCEKRPIPEHLFAEIVEFL